MNVNINTARIREVGTDEFPALANEFSTAAGGMSLAQDNYAAEGLSGSEFLSQWSLYNAQIILMMKTSAKHLTACGEALVDAANDHDWTDEDNSRSLAKPFTSSLEEEVGQ